MSAVTTRAPKQRKTINSYKAEKSKFHVFRSAYLAIEGIGAQGSYDIRGHVAVHGRQLHISAMGFTPALQVHTHMNNIHFHANATLMQGDKVIVRKHLARKPSEAWPLDRFVAIGSAQIEIPPAPEGVNYQLVITGSYQYAGNLVGATPFPSNARTVINIVGVTK